MDFTHIRIYVICNDDKELNLWNTYVDKYVQVTSNPKRLSMCVCKRWHISWHANSTYPVDESCPQTYTGITTTLLNLNYSEWKKQIEYLQTDKISQHNLSETQDFCFLTSRWSPRSINWREKWRLGTLSQKWTTFP